MTTEEKINKIFKDENLQLEFMSCLVNELNSDDEPPSRKFDKLVYYYNQDKELINDMLINLCGWSMNSLCNMTLGIKD